MSKFYVLDVETANPDCSSICQIGIAEFQNGELTDSWKTYVNPNDYFDYFQIQTHGITEEMVADAPAFSDVYEMVRKTLEGNIVIHHTHFDRVAIERGCSNCSLDFFEASWLDSAKIARRTWIEFSQRGYGLSNLANHFGIEYKAHDALEDAIATGKIVLLALEKSGLSLDEWSYQVKRRITPYSGKPKTSINLEGNPEGILAGENLVFTGTLFITRKEAAEIAAELGCNVTDSVTQKTTILVLGTQDNFKLAGYKKSSKHRKAEKLIESGMEIRILSEDDFRSLAEVKPAGLA